MIGKCTFGMIKWMNDHAFKSLNQSSIKINHSKWSVKKD